MTYEMKEMTGSLFEKEDKVGQQPDFTGNVKIEGKEYRLAGWWTESRSGKTYMSLKVSDPEEYRRSRDQQHRPGPSKPTPPPRRMSNEEFEKRRGDFKSRAAGDFADDDIPF